MLEVALIDITRIRAHEEALSAYPLGCLGFQFMLGGDRQQAVNVLLAC
jgi:hypothetical protein